jgi:hypothetical protein
MPIVRMSEAEVLGLEVLTMQVGVRFDCLADSGEHAWLL